MGPRMLIVAKGTPLGDFILRYYWNIIETFEKILKILQQYIKNHYTIMLSFTQFFFQNYFIFKSFYKSLKTLKYLVITTFKIFLNIFYSFRLFSNLYICSYGMLWMMLLYK
jgi:hypothetical protein